MSSAASPRKLLFFIPEDWYVCSHRLPLIAGARSEGMDVVVVTRVGRKKQPMVDAGAAVVHTRLRRGFRNPLRDLSGLIDLIQIYRQQRPDIVHHVTPKSCLYGSLVAWLTGVKPVVNAMAGLGFLYTSRSLKARLARPLVALAFKWILSRPDSRIIVQNNDDGDFFHQQIGVPADRIVLVRGSGVDIDVFEPAAQQPAGKVRICLAARMIGDKGLFETVAAARLLQAQREDIEFVFAGEPDVENPSGVSAAQLQAWHDEGAVTWVGRVDDVASLLKTCHIGLLPSYGEGFPKSLLEAAACGLPLIATDTTGCREICLGGVNGLYVPLRDPAAIAAAVTQLADDPELRARFGRESRKMVVENFSEAIVVSQTVDLYRNMLGEEPGNE